MSLGSVHTVTTLTDNAILANVSQPSDVWLASDGACAYFTDFFNKNVKQVSLGGGTAIELVSSQTAPYGIAVDTNNIYWANQGTSPNYTDGSVMSIPLNGGTASPLATGQHKPTGVATDGAHVYWTNNVANGTVMKVPVSGGVQPTPLATNQGYPWAIAVDGTSVYWTTVGDGKIMKVTPK
jgi:hypothetical protein